MRKWLVRLEIPVSLFISQNLTEVEAVTGCTFACICHTVFRVFSSLQINWQPFYLRQLLKFHPFDWLIEVYLQTEGQGTHHKVVTLQAMPGFSPLFNTPEKRVTLKKTRSSKEHHGSPCDGSAKSAGPVLCKKLRSNQAHRPSAFGRISEQFL